MVLTASLLFLTVCQVPQTETPAPAGGEEEIHLDSGEVIRGTIIKRAGNYVEIRIDENTVIGFERSRVAKVAPVEPRAPVVAAARLDPRDEWFELHDAAGTAVGYVHGLVQPAEDGTVRISEEWFFHTDQGSTQVTVLETVGADLEPLASFYHERVLTKTDRLVAEQLVDARVERGELAVLTRNLRGSQRQSYPFQKTALFPLCFLEQVRQDRQTKVHTAHQEMFDARTAEFRTFTVRAVGSRTVELRGRTTTVREVQVSDGAKRNAEWIDAEGRVLRREVNGSALVAERVTEAEARRVTVERGKSRFGVSFAAAKSGRIALVRPNPIWRVGARDDSSVTLEAPLYGASVTLLELDQLAENVQLATAGDTVVRWLRLSLGSRMRVESRDGVQVRQFPALRITTTWSIDHVGRSDAFRGECYVFRVGARHLALSCSAPRDAFAPLALDFERIVESVQVAADEIEPKLQGPLSETAPAK